MSESVKCPECGGTDLHYNEKRQQFFCNDCSHVFGGEKTSAPLRIFLSYGHDRNEELVRRIRADLEARGHYVWFDKSDIKAGQDWRRAITDGITDSDRVLSFLSKHSTRDPGVCLDEIAIAIGVKGGNIQTILVEGEQEVRPPTTVSHIQWLDMHDWWERHEADGAAWEEWYQGRLAEIVEVVESAESRRFAGEIATLEDHLKPISSDSRIRQLLQKELVGRRWLFEALEQWRVAADRASRLFWITGAPGVGKSAFVAHLTHYGRDKVVAVQFCEYDKPDHRDARRVVRSLAFQIAARLPDYRKLLLALPEIRQLDDKNPDELFDYLLTGPLRHVIDGGRDRGLIVIDALDEAGGSGRNELVETLVRNAPRLPDWVGIVVTSRPESDVAAPLQGLEPLVIDAASEANQGDIRIYLKRELAPQLAQHTDSTLLLEKILGKSEGVFLYAERFCDDVRTGHLSLDHPEQFPDGLGGTFYQYLQRLFPDLKEFRKSIRPPLRAILAAREPLPVEVLRRLFDWDDEQVRDFTRELGSLFPVSSEGEHEVTRAYHKSLADWLTDKAKAGPYFVSPIEGHRMLAEFCWQEYRVGTGELSAYALAHLPTHLVATRRWRDLETVLTDLAFLEAKARGGLAYGLVVDYNLALAEMPDSTGLRPWESFYKLALSRITAGENLFTIAYNQSAAGPVAAAAAELRRRGRFPDLWIERLNRPGAFSEALCHAVFTTSGLPLSRVAWSHPAGRQVMAVDAHHELHLWDVERACPLHPPGLFPTKVTAFAPHPTQELVAFTRSTGEVLVWDLDHDAIEPVTSRPSGSPTHCLWNFGGSRLLVAWPDGEVEVHATGAPGDPLCRVPGQGCPLVRIAWSPTENQYVSASAARALHLVKAEAEPSISALEGPQAIIVACAWSRDGSRFLTVDEEGCLFAWTSEGTLSGRCSLRVPFHPRDCAFNPAEDCVALVGDSGRVLVHYLGTARAGPHSVWFPGHRGRVCSCAWSHTGRFLATASWDRTVRVWDLAGRESPGIMAEHTDAVDGAAWHPESPELATAASDGRLRLWRPFAMRPRGNRGEAHTALHDPTASVTIHQCAYSDARKMTASCSEQGTVYLLEALSGEEIARFQAHNGPALTCVWNPEGRYLLTGGCDRFARFWDLSGDDAPSGPKLEFGPFDHWITACCWGPEGDAVVLATQSGEVVLQPLDDHTIVSRSFAPRSVSDCAFSPSGDRLALACSDGRTRLWSPASEADPGVLSGHTGVVRACRWTRCGQWLLTCGEDSEARIWSTGQPLQCLHTMVHPAAVGACAWICGDALVLTACADRRLRVWDPASAVPLAVCNVDFAVETLSVAPDGTTVFCMDTDGNPLVLSIQGGSHGQPSHPGLEGAT